jgi:hypothetical protein
MYLEHNMKRIEKEFNAITGQETITERDETAQEITEREAFQTEIAIKEAEAEAKATAKAALLAQLGITEEQARLLLN